VPKKSTKVLIRNTVVLTISIILLIVGAGCIYADHMLGRINYIENTASNPNTDPLFKQENGTNAKSGLLGGLYHDDAITNILVMGVDDYQPNDPGRSDSMILVSIDSRHNKLKLTSFMRDLYVAIPGHGNNRINVGYAVGGPQLAVKTIESNFGTDIDRFVLIDFDSFSQIVDKLGGVNIELSQIEADLINRNSGDPKRNLKEGNFLLTGKQALYYARIRNKEDNYDFGRTQRQRKLFSSIVNKFKSADLGTINQAMYDVLPLMATNMTKNEILDMATNSPTYLNYPISQNRIPADGEFDGDDVLISGTRAKVLVPDLDKCRQSVASFIYEDEIPTGEYSKD
jgi:LCP family protein required for cell wall assembly